MPTRAGDDFEAWINDVDARALLFSEWLELRDARALDVVRPLKFAAIVAAVGRAVLCATAPVLPGAGVAISAAGGALGALGKNCRVTPGGNFARPR